VVKKMKDKTFARAVNRDDIRRGAEELGMPLIDLVALVIEAQRPVAPLLGLDGGPGPDLPDAPPPAAP
jgi:predicted hydrolase (HD superfamily)